MPIHATLDAGGRLPLEQLPASVAGAPAWTDITNKPTTFVPNTHTHVVADVSGLQTALDAKQVAGSYAAATHIHTVANVTGLQTALDTKQVTLVSGTSLKTVNGTSLLGSGDLVISGGGGGNVSVASAIMTGTQASTVVTMANVTQLVLPVEASAVYLVDCFVTFQSAATTTGLGLGFTSPTGCRCMVEMVVPITSTTAASQLRTTFPNAAVTANTGVVVGTGVTAINSNHTARISGIIRNGPTAGNFQIQFRSEIAASAVTLQIGSELTLLRVV